MSRTYTKLVAALVFGLGSLVWPGCADREGDYRNAVLRLERAQEELEKAEKRKTGAAVVGAAALGRLGDVDDTESVLPFTATGGTSPAGTPSPAAATPGSVGANIPEPFSGWAGMPAGSMVPAVPPPQPTIPAPPTLAPIQPFSPAQMLGLAEPNGEAMRQQLLLDARLGYPMRRARAVMASNPEYMAEVQRAALQAQALQAGATMQGYGSQVGAIAAQQEHQARMMEIEQKADENLLTIADNMPDKKQAQFIRNVVLQRRLQRSQAMPVPYGLQQPQAPAASPPPGGGAPAGSPPADPYAK
jgi:hypothetical protein